MSKYKNHQPVSSKTINDAEKIARAIQKPNQTKEQTRLIAQGIQKGIAEYKKQQKNKSRELDKLKKKKIRKQQENTDKDETTESQCKKSWLPWALLIISWLGMALFIVIKI
ncbi:MAG: DUF2956 domain-containing protein [Thiotrichaceae bacterium]|nr:DUF2956 domain-containing protein [Thiotrichaceae bacterium]